MWCVCEYDSTNDYREAVLTMKGKCMKDHVPENGFYLFKEGSRGTWIITSAIKVLHILTDDERDAIMKSQGYDEVAAYAPYRKAFEKRMAI